jgi:hypothetical protein
LGFSWSIRVKLAPYWSRIPWPEAPDSLSDDWFRNFNVVLRLEANEFPAISRLAVGFGELPENLRLLLLFRFLELDIVVL